MKYTHMNGAHMNPAYMNCTCHPAAATVGDTIDFLQHMLAACIVFVQLAVAAAGAWKLIQGGVWLRGAVRNLRRKGPTAGHSARPGRERMKSSNWMCHDLD